MSQVAVDILVGNPDCFSGLQFSNAGGNAVQLIVCLTEVGFNCEPV
jgi:hypothetical protein